jgi:hypothetical protein
MTRTPTYISKKTHNKRVTTHLLSTRSVLFPTSTMITSLPLSVRTSSIHFEVFKKDCLPTTRNEQMRKNIVTKLTLFLKNIGMDKFPVNVATFLTLLCLIKKSSSRK